MNLKSLGFVILLGACSFLVGCGSASDAIDATKGMPELMNRLRSDTNTNMDKTNQAIHKQTLVVALDDMLKSENTKYLSPPTGMMPGAEAFAKEATPEELAKIFYVFGREVAEVVPDDSMVKKTPDGKWTADALNFDHGKLVKLTAMMAIAGLTPQDKVEQLVAQQITRAGRYEPYVYNFLALRVLFIKVYLVEEGLFAYKLTNPGMFEDALTYLSQIDYVASLPFANKIAIQTTGLLEQELNLNLVVAGGTDDTNIFGSDRSPVGLWKHMQRSFVTELDPAYQLNESGAPKSAMAPDVLSRMQNIKGQIDQGNALVWPHP